MNQQILKNSRAPEIILELSELKLWFVFLNLRYEVYANYGCVQNLHNCIILDTAAGVQKCTICFQVGCSCSLPVKEAPDELDKGSTFSRPEISINFSAKYSKLKCEVQQERASSFHRKLIFCKSAAGRLLQAFRTTSPGSVPVCTCTTCTCTCALLLKRLSYSFLWTFCTLVSRLFVL